MTTFRQLAHIVQFLCCHKIWALARAADEPFAWGQLAMLPLESANPHGTSGDLLRDLGAIPSLAGYRRGLRRGWAAPGHHRRVRSRRLPLPPLRRAGANLLRGRGTRNLVSSGFFPLCNLSAHTGAADQLLLRPAPDRTSMGTGRLEIHQSRRTTETLTRLSSSGAEPTPDSLETFPSEAIRIPFAVGTLQAAACRSYQATSSRYLVSTPGMASSARR